MMEEKDTPGRSQKDMLSVAYRAARAIFLRAQCLSIGSEVGKLFLNICISIGMLTMYVSR